MATNNSGVVGILRALFTADTAQFDTAMRKSSQASEGLNKSVENLGKSLVKLTPQAERMVKAFSGEKLLKQADNLVASIQKLGGAEKLTAAEQARVNAQVTTAIEK